MSTSPTKTTRKVLVVTLHFAPVNTPDMQRVRMALPFFRSMGWEATVLAVAPDLVEGRVLEPLLEKTYPADVRIVRVGGIPVWATRIAGIGSLWLRCGARVRAAGDKLLSDEAFDLVFFSTTQFDAFTLGPTWKAKFGVPYVLDYQDPWVNDYYDRTGTRPPGGWLKFGFSQWCARRREPAVLREAAAVIAVSGAYGVTFAKMYPWFAPRKVRFIPFGAAEGDFALARSYAPPHSLIPFGDGLVHLVYTGRCGPDMSTSLKILFRAFKKYLSIEPVAARRIRFHFVGTDYAPRPFGREWAMPVAVSEGVEEYVSEQCYRVPYFDALYYLTHADALIAVGSNDPTYSASKIFPYVLAQRPILVVFHEKSPVMALAKEMNCGQRYTFNDANDIDIVAEEIGRDWFIGGTMKELPNPDLSAFRPYSAESMTRRLVTVFDEVVDPARVHL